MIQELDAIGARAIESVEAASSSDDLEQLRVQYLGKKGELSLVLRGLGQVSAEDRPKIGARANEWKTKIESLLDLRKSKLESTELNARLASEKIDASLPARLAHVGSLHPITQVTRRIVEVLSRLGFEVTSGPEVETDWACFEAVNIPADHPARDMQDTFFLGPGLVLRTHTTPAQVRTMLTRPWPVRVLCPGAVYRRDNDATHSPMFHQIEGLWVDKKVSLADLKGTLEYFSREVFGSETKIRLRPSYFPFVEPGVEVDVSCFRCRKNLKANCTVCKGTGWLEVLGAGMVHPALFKNCGYKDAPTGFAFGMGIERMAMLLYEIPDLRMLFQSDARFLRQFL